MVDRKNLEDIKSWLDQIPLTFTQTAEVLNAKSVMNKVRNEDNCSGRSSIDASHQLNELWNRHANTWMQEFSGRN